MYTCISNPVPPRAHAQLLITIIEHRAGSIIKITDMVAVPGKVAAPASDGCFYGCFLVIEAHGGRCFRVWTSL